jgi:hypothetical protein
MKQILKKILPQVLIEAVQHSRAMSAWRDRGYLDNSPQFVKESVFQKYGIADAEWVETGTYMGETTKFLSEKFPHVYTIEPSLELYKAACARFEGGNVTLFNDVSENVFPKLLPTLSGNVNFWLDGHYSAGVTFKGDKDCPVEDELRAIEENLKNFNKLSILIDDVRCFLPSNSEYPDYPSIDYLVDWARKLNMRWRIEHDIFIIQKS